MESSLYQQTLSQAWSLTKKKKTLWIFGLFAALPGGAGGEYERFLNLQKFQDARNLILSLFEKGENGRSWTEFFTLFGNFFRSENIGGTLVIGGFAVLLILVSMISQGALVSGVVKLSQKQAWVFRDGFRQGWKNAMPVLGLNILGRLVVYGSLFVVGFPVLLMYFFTQLESWTIIFYVIFFLALIPMDIIFSFIVRYAIIFHIVKGQSVMHSFTSAVRLFRRNWILSLEMALFLFLVSLGAGLIVLLISAVILQGMIAYTNFLNFWFGLILAVILIVGSILATFQFSVWTILGLQLLDTNHKSKIEEIAEGVFAKKMSPTQ